MATKTYYTILGVSSTESPSGIRAAYRGLAKRLHPDVAGEQATGAFREVSEAYSVLSDPQRRRDYNHELKQTANGDDGPVDRRPREPLTRQPVTVVGDPRRTPRSFEEIPDRFLWNSAGSGFPDARQLEVLDFEVLLTPDESVAGCTLPLDVPVYSRCPQCRGSGRDWMFPCPYCRQQGMIEERERLHVRIPPMAGSGTYEVPLQPLGIHGSTLRFHVFVEGGPGWGRKE